MLVALFCPEEEVLGNDHDDRSKYARIALGPSWQPPINSIPTRQIINAGLHVYY